MNAHKKPSRFNSDSKKVTEKRFSKDSKPYKKTNKTSDNEKADNEGYKKRTFRTSTSKTEDFSKDSKPYKKTNKTYGKEKADNEDYKKRTFRTSTSKTEDFSKDKRPKKQINNSEKFSKSSNNDDTIKKTKTILLKKDKKLSNVKSLPVINDKTIRLNKYIANAGICSRREADVFIKAGSVSVNGKIITEMGYQVQHGDVVSFGDEKLNPETKRYILLNKPKDYITTTDDEKGRKTVMELVANACSERIVPVGRLDRKTTGLLLLTNDGDLAKKLTHPKHRVKKLYHVTLDKNVSVKDIQTIIDPDFLVEELPVFVDSIAYVEGASRNEVGIGLHSGRNRIVRKIFESLGYDVVKLDRVVFAGITKKDLPRGHWRHLTQQEIINLKNS